MYQDKFKCLTIHVLFFCKLMYLFSIRVTKGQDILATIWDGTSCYPRTKIFPGPTVPGQEKEQKSEDKLFCPWTKTISKKTGKRHSKKRKDILKQEKYILKKAKMFYNRNP